MVQPQVSCAINLRKLDSKSLKSCLSVLNQDYDNFRVLIQFNYIRVSEIVFFNDNFLPKLKKNSSRKFYFDSKKSQGLVEDWNSSLKKISFLADSPKYFFWGNDQDIFGRYFLSQCVSELENNKKVSSVIVLSNSTKKYIEKMGNFGVGAGLRIYGVSRIGIPLSQVLHPDILWWRQQLLHGETHVKYSKSGFFRDDLKYGNTDKKLSYQFKRTFSSRFYYLFNLIFTWTFIHDLLFLKYVFLLKEINLNSKILFLKSILIKSRSEKKIKKFRSKKYKKRRKAEIKQIVLGVKKFQEE